MDSQGLDFRGAAADDEPDALSSSIYCQTTRRMNLRQNTVIPVQFALGILSKEEKGKLRNCFKDTSFRNGLKLTASLNGI